MTGSQDETTKDKDPAEGEASFGCRKRRFSLAKSAKKTTHRGQSRRTKQKPFAHNRANSLPDIFERKSSVDRDSALEEMEEQQ